MIITTTPDKERAGSMLKMAQAREEFASSIDREKFSTIAAEHYYEIVKELATAIILLDGLKAIGENAHKETIDSLSRYQEFSQADIIFMNDLRIKRNKSLYEGKMIDKVYLENNQDKVVGLIQKLKQIIEDKLK